MEGRNANLPRELSGPGKGVRRSTAEYRYAEGDKEEDPASLGAMAGHNGGGRREGDIHTPDLDVNPSEDRDIKGLHAVFGVRFAVRWVSGWQEAGKTEVFSGWPPVRYL